MDEAQRLADRVAIIAAGRIVAEGAPTEVGSDRPRVRMTFRVPAGVGVDDLPGDLRADVDVRGDRIELGTDRPLPVLETLAVWARSRGVDLPQLEVRQRSLEDVYLALTTGE